jgi:hypothetical protein
LLLQRFEIDERLGEVYAGLRSDLAVEDVH